MEFSKLDPQNLARMVEVSRVLNSATNLDELLTFIIREAADLTQSEAASILLFDPQSRQLHFKASSNEVSPEMLATPVPLDNSIAGAVLLADKPMISDNVAEDERWYSDVDQAIQFQTKAILGVPMRDVNKGPVGVLEALNKLDGSFTESDVQTLSVLADIAGVAVEKARLIEELQQANVELSELDQLKSDFIAIASHELRTPLSVILGYVSFLREEADQMMADQLGNVLQAAVHLRGLIQDMLNLRYVDAGSATLNLSEADLCRIIRDMELPKDETAVAKEQRIFIRLPEKPVNVLVDTSIMEVVIGNLFNNAVKFTDQQGSISIRVEMVGNEARLSIADNGIGIPNDKLDRIFKRFYQVESALRRQHEGMGLGLSIAKELVELHNGRIWAESVHGKGSRFHIALQLSENSR